LFRGRDFSSGRVGCDVNIIARGNRQKVVVFLG
jgi:hypothetical protein